MSLSPEMRHQIESELAAARVVLFMKGTPARPQCGFSARTIAILEKLVPGGYRTVDVLPDPSVREAIKQYAEWPTIPQLYIDGVFQGGCDLVTEMYNRGELHGVLGLPSPSLEPPEIVITDAAAVVLRSALMEHADQSIHLSIAPNWEHQFHIGPAIGHEVAASNNGVTILVDLDTASRARNLQIGVVDGSDGPSLTVKNPNMPPPVQPLEVEALKALRDAGTELELIDVRTVEERELARIEGSRLLDQEMLALASSMPKVTKFVFYCHTGVRSLQAAEHFRSRGFVDVSNLEGGIDAWSRRVDKSVPLY